MKKLIVSAAAVFILLNASAQFLRSEQSTKVGEARIETKTIINGEHVSGTPFLQDQWLPGSIVLEDGRVYDNFKIKFNLISQAVFFTDGKDSLEVSDPVKEIFITGKTDPKHLINITQFEKSKKPLFFEPILDNEKATLLKTYRKVVSSGNSGILEISSLKYLKIISEYYFYDKVNKKLSLIKASGNNIKSILHLSPEQMESLTPTKYDFSEEANVLLFFTKYFNS